MKETVVSLILMNVYITDVPIMQPAIIKSITTSVFVSPDFKVSSLIQKRYIAHFIINHINALYISPLVIHVGPITSL